MNFLVALSVCAAVLGKRVTEPFGPGPRADGEKLVFVSAVWRHGDRGPIGPLVDDRYEERHWKNGYGMLTEKGADQHFRLGQWARERYVNKLQFLPANYSDGLIHVTATVSRRTQESAENNLKGMYGLNGLQMPEIIVKKEKDFSKRAFDMCPRAIDLFKVIDKTPEAQKMFNIHKDAMKMVAKAYGKDLAQSQSCWDTFAVLDTFVLQRIQNLTLADGYDYWFDDIYYIYTRCLKFMFGYGMETFQGIDLRIEMARAQGGIMLEELIADMIGKAVCRVYSRYKPECKTTLKKHYQIHSAHDFTLLGLMATFGFRHLDFNYDDDTPLASAMFIELWESISRQYYVRVVYRKSDDKVYDLTNSIDGCRHKKPGCMLDEFVERSEKYMPEDTAENTSEGFESHLLTVMTVERRKSQKRKAEEIKNAGGKENNKNGAIRNRVEEEEGHQQSPIDIVTSAVTHDPSLKSSRLKINYCVGDAETVEVAHKGFHCWMKSGAKSTIAGTHLPPGCDYRLAQFHAHWAEHKHEGSEHYLNGKPYSGEIHCVFWNTSYGTPENSFKHADGMTVLAIFLHEHRHDNLAFEPLIDAIKLAQHAPDHKAKIDSNFDLNLLMPEKHFFYTYHGSLTTPPHDECVIWTILRRHVHIGVAQMNTLRSIVKRNVRHVQPLEGRQIRASFTLRPKDHSMENGRHADEHPLDDVDVH